MMTTQPIPGRGQRGRGASDARGAGARRAPDTEGVAGASDPAAAAASVARRFFALSEPTRLRIVEMLTRGERCVCELVDALGAAQSRLSFHLRTLKDAGVVRDERRGRWIYYSLDPSVLEEMASYLGVGAERARECCAPGWGSGGESGCCG